jgi:hypothetical protein
VAKALAAGEVANPDHQFRLSPFKSKKEITDLSATSTAYLSECGSRGSFNAIESNAIAGSEAESSSARR